MFTNIWDTTELVISIAERNFIRSCKEILTSKGKQLLNGELMQKFYKVPESGIKIKLEDGEEKTYYPLLSSKALDDETVKRLGSFSNDKGVTIFVYYDGTYITRDEQAIAFLNEAGYQRRNFSTL